MRSIQTFTAIVAIVLPATTFAASGTCSTDISLPLVRERTGHVSTQLVVNGKLARFLVDTGANVSTLDTTEGARLNPVVTPAEGLPPGEGDTKLSVAAGAISLGMRPFAVMSLQFINIPSRRYGTEPFVGQLGASFFEAFAARIDFEHMTLCLRLARTTDAK